MITIRDKVMENGQNQQLRDRLAQFTMEPSPAVWKGIEAANPVPGPKRMRPFLFGSAAMLVVAGLLFWYLSGDFGNSPAPEPASDQLLSGNITPGNLPESSSDAITPFQQDSDNGSDPGQAKAIPVAPLNPSKEVVNPAGGVAEAMPVNPDKAATQQQRSEKSRNVTNPILPRNAQPSVTLEPVQQPVDSENTNTGDADQATPEKPLPVEVFIPNAFSPNHDGLNDIFLPVIQNHIKVQDYRLQVYSRSGLLYFESLNAEVGWDGSFQGAVVEDQICVYVVSFSDPEGNPVIRRGTVAIIK
jgi:gliding motility-associated-like protein